MYPAAVLYYSDTRFRIASVSKQFTVFTLMQLVEAGKIRLDDDVSCCLGFSLRNPAHPDTPITVRMLANHTASLRNGNVHSIPPSISVREFFAPDGRYKVTAARLPLQRHASRGRREARGIWRNTGKGIGSECTIKIPRHVS